MPNVMPLQADDPRRVGRYRLTGRMGSRTGVDGSTVRVFTAKMVDGDMLVTLLAATEWRTRPGPVHREHAWPAG
jgi:hypothetical protein